MVAQKVGYFMETEEKKIYTIEDIARELGVSKTTVSRAISGKGRISQATRDRVRAPSPGNSMVITILDVITKTFICAAPQA